jgi:hypothetical protein
MNPVMLSDDEAVKQFRDLREGWLMQLANGWWAYYGDERPIGPFNTKTEASRAGLQARAEKQKPR